MSRFERKISSSLPSTQVASLLLVNDNRTQLDAMSLLLNFEGYAVYTADDGESAIRMLQEVVPDLIVSDVVMPGIDGIRLCRRIKSNPLTSSIPILLVTGLRFDDSGVLEGFEAGADDYLEVGGPPSLLLKKIELLIGQRRERQAREQVERALRESEERFRTLLESVTDYAIFTLDAQERVASWNAGAEKITGYSEAEIIGQHFSSLFRPEERLRGEPQRQLRAAVATGRDESEGYRVRRDGSLFWASDITTLLQHDSGELRGFSKVTWDMTDRKRSEEALVHQKAILESVIEASVDGILVASLEGKIVAFNGRLVEMWGVDRRKLAGLTDREVLRSVEHMLSDPRELMALFDHLHEHPDEYERGEVTLKDGRIFDRYTAPITNPDGENNGRVWFFRDLTEKKHLEEQLRQSQKMEAVGRLAGGIAHDFNNLLTAIIGYSQLLSRREEVLDFMRGPIEEIEKAGQRAASLTSQLMVFSRKQVLQPKVLDLNLVVRGIEKMMRRLIGEHITVVTSLYKDLGRVRADPGQVEQIIVNLAVNARDAMPKGGTLVIETGNVDFDDEFIKHHIALKRGPYVMLSLSDSGVGMDLQTLAHIFEPFFTTKEIGRGTGLGLATVYAIVKTFGGSIWVYSEPGQGTTFKIYLPRIEVPADEENSFVRGEAPTGSETILLVEDDETVRRLARRILQMGGYELLEATNGEEALRRYEQHTGTIHLVLTDVVMPQMSGGDLIAQVRLRYPEVKALFMSGYISNTFFEDGVVETGVAFLQKPFSAETLLRKVRDVLDEP